MGPSLRVSLAVLLFTWGIATQNVASEFRDKTAEVCPRFSGCYCDFKQKTINCYNSTAIPNLPSGIHRADFDGGHGNSLIVGVKYELPLNVLHISFTGFKDLDLYHMSISESSSIHVFELRENTLVRLREDVFRCAKYLHILNLRGNNFTGMSTGLLRGLRLKKLVLAGSPDQLTASYLVESICQMNTTELKQLELSDNELESIPEDLVKCVPSVVFLHLGGNNFFKPGCLDSLSGVMFYKLVLDNCNINQSRTLQFIRGKQLNYFSFRNNDLSTANTKEIFCKLEAHALRYLSASGNNIGNIDDDYFSCIRNTTHFQTPTLDFANGNIRTISVNAFRQLQIWSSVNINLYSNSVSNVSFLLAFKSVQSLNLGNNKLYYFPAFRHDGKCMEIYPRRLSLSSNSIARLSASDFECLPRLETLDLSVNAINVLTSKTLYGLHSLKSLNLVRNRLTHLQKDSLPPNLHTVDLMNNYLRYHGVSSLERLTKLRVLLISGPGQRRILIPNRTLSALERLAVSVEWSTAIHIISALKNIDHLSMTKCNMRSIPYEELKKLKKLTWLDVSSNLISAIDVERLKEIPKLSALTVASNTLECGCAMLPFSESLRQSGFRIRILEIVKTKCASPSKYLGVTLFNFDKDCRSRLPIILPSALGSIVLLLAIVIFISVRNRGYIRYGFMLIRARWRGYGSIEGCTFKWDAFVSFNDADKSWVYNRLKPKLEEEAGYRICLHHRDFTIGEFITDNIVNCIDRSRKTLLILSDDFAKSQWCQLELSVAQHKLFDDDRDVLILVKLSDVSSENITGTMKVVMRTKTYITWSDDVAEQKLFWKQLVLALKRPPGVGLEELEDWENCTYDDDHE